MPWPEKTSKAVLKTVRLNPINQQDKEVLEIIASFEGKFSFKQIVVDAILRADGHTPEMYSKDTEMFTKLLTKMESLIASAVQQIISAAPADRHPEDHKPDNGETSPFARKFAKTFLERQQSAIGDQEEDE